MATMLAMETSDRGAWGESDKGMLPMGAIAAVQRTRAHGGDQILIRRGGSMTLAIHLTVISGSRSRSSRWPALPKRPSGLETPYNP
ncbi:MAG: hypothetical protein Fur0042_23380 [Cyanophyceae cyanobacterium]